MLSASESWLAVLTVADITERRVPVKYETDLSRRGLQIIQEEVTASPVYRLLFVPSGCGYGRQSELLAAVFFSIEMSSCSSHRSD
jgi:hypothetical protein